MNPKLQPAERRTKAAPATVTFGPMDHGRAVMPDEWRAANYAPGHKYEIIHGKLYVSPAANHPHDYLRDWLRDAIRDYGKDHPKVVRHVAGGARVFVPDEDAETCPEPDVAVYREYPFHIPLRERTWESMSPALVVEVLSGDLVKDLVRNVDLYLRVPSIQEYWLVNQWADDDPFLRVLRRRGKSWAKPLDFHLGDTYTTKLLPGFSLLLDPNHC